MNHDIFIFGSTVRGEVGASSDIDVLVIPVNTVSPEVYPASWSIYSRETIRSYYEEGRLFAWHLHLESRCIYSASSEHWLETLGCPAAYRSAREDVASLTALLCDSLFELQSGTESVIYELGICYTALRDIAMSASWHLTGRPCFSRYAPFMLPGAQIPIGLEVYEQAMMARHFSTRGSAQPRAPEDAIAAFIKAPLLEWAQTLGDVL
ncbi:nucleotidyltransferase domain-containing protein [Pseudomonas chlororaphis]|uniref:Polymerase nucleotidyl transferase domain-containing protein n=1 Tax=Pseudomonas chlororaphis TaxID=587753 RepID=A0AAX3G5T8_9PSED|nr:nucleotidyltransferase domain-containing protein [Pseudomonas chlororaphis]AZC37059.1 hypothetical protein C4K37_2672 [Pseudomonas chlororaphis subsp. piscium]AZC43605.1 hypothetical protein C4K36_2680 [Pseudomonas chlororaphis subsp. piscium]AZC50295.1 hypothetical protein C4K35_2712 [Pseudomonas chlororaphis subsp. piscium]AZC95364.1 hypothetical protein C4K28_2636 [Pseudomonas chlororaphis subsp. piscium]WDG75468.1 nucleotidyltransferase domain-containing protein [Pseudomonas chlororaphi